MRTETKILQKDTRKQKELAIKWQMKCSVDLYKMGNNQRKNPLFREKGSVLVTIIRE